jgi:excisionase family DNA binding protein
MMTLYTTAEAAEILRVKPSWLERQAAARSIPFAMLGGTYRFTTAHLAAIVAMHENPPPLRRVIADPPPRRPARRKQADMANPGVAPRRSRPRPAPRRRIGANGQSPA